MPKRIEELANAMMRKADIEARKYPETDHKVGRRVITISRTMGSGARIIGQKLAKDLGWTLWAREILDSMAENTTVSRHVVEAFDERSHSELEILMRDLLGDHEMGSFIYAKHLISTVLTIAQAGNAIILGRGANFILPYALNIRIDAPFDVRVRNMMTFENLTEQQAREKLQRSDRERHEFVVRTFGREKVDKFLFDLSLSTGEFTNDNCVAIIKTAMNCRYELKVAA